MYELASYLPRRPVCTKQLTCLSYLCDPVLHGFSEVLRLFLCSSRHCQVDRLDRGERSILYIFDSGRPVSIQDRATDTTRTKLRAAYYHMNIACPLTGVASCIRTGRDSLPARNQSIRITILNQSCSERCNKQL